MSSVSVSVDPCLWLLSASKGSGCYYASANKVDNIFSCTPTYYTLTPSGLQSPTQVSINYNSYSGSYCNVPIVAVALIDNNGNFIGAIDANGNSVIGSSYSNIVSISKSSSGILFNQSYTSTPNIGFNIVITVSNKSSNNIYVSKVILFACNGALNSSSTSCASTLVFTLSSPIIIPANSSNDVNLIFGIH